MIERSDSAPRRSPAVRLTLAVLAVLITAGFLALGTWQVFRLQWKLDLIRRVDQRVHAAAAPAPGPAWWPRVNAANDEYRHVLLRGHFLAQSSAKVQAVTELGSGYWLLTPLCGDDGNIVIVNRGFITAETAAAMPVPVPVPVSTPACTAGAGDTVKLSGLLRISEPSSITGIRAMSRPSPRPATWRPSRPTSSMPTPARKPVAATAGPSAA